MGCYEAREERKRDLRLVECWKRSIGVQRVCAPSRRVSGLRRRWRRKNGGRSSVFDDDDEEEEQRRSKLEEDAT